MPKESNKLFDLFFSHKQIRKIRGRKKSKGQVFILVYRLGEDGYLKNESKGMLQFWALRTRSYKTKAEV